MTRRGGKRRTIGGVDAKETERDRGRQHRKTVLILWPQPPIPLMIHFEALSFRTGIGAGLYFLDLRYIHSYSARL